jgi:hypothetical protein
VVTTRVGEFLVVTKYIGHEVGFDEPLPHVVVTTEFRGLNVLEQSEFDGFDFLCPLEEDLEGAELRVKGHPVEVAVVLPPPFESSEVPACEVVEVVDMFLVLAPADEVAESVHMGLNSRFAVSVFVLYLFEVPQICLTRVDWLQVVRVVVKIAVVLVVTALFSVRVVV